jgi:hypothetical protein
MKKRGFCLAKPKFFWKKSAFPQKSRRKFTYKYEDSAETKSEIYCCLPWDNFNEWPARPKIAP